MKAYFNPISPQSPIVEPNEIVVIENYLTNEQCEKIIEYAQQYQAQQTSIGDFTQNGTVKRTQSHGFIAERIDLPKDTPLNRTGHNICNNIFKKIVPENYKVFIKSYEMPHILRYTQGGTYGIHSDSHNYDPSSKSWKKVANRDYSSILYLNDEFTGGTLSFPALNLRVTPQKGMLVIFPSHDKYMHSAEPTLSGTRYAFVTWAAQRGVKGIPGAPKGDIIRLK